MLRSLADAETGKVFNLRPSRKVLGEVKTRAKVKLDQLHAASELNHIRVLRRARFPTYSFSSMLYE